MTALPSALSAPRPLPFGATVCADGVHFSLWSEHADAIELCLFDSEGTRELKRYRLHGPDHGVFAGFLDGAGPGLVYGYRAHGPFAPDDGQRFNAHKLLLDPYAREIVGRFHHHELHYAYPLGDPQGARAFDARDNAALALKARVAPPLPRIEWSRPHTPRERAVIYELHVRGFTLQHPGIASEDRGRFAGLASEAAIAHFHALGITSLCLLPVQFAVSEAALEARRLSNYWGYNTLGFFAPQAHYGSREAFRTMVRALHQAGIEVLIDVVYNHSAEGDELGPTLSFRGLDNASWYRLAGDDRSRGENFSGCGNTLNVAHPRVTEFVLDSLRYWREELGVDGFRFDLAATLGRTAHGFDAACAFFIALKQDPVLRHARLIAEPWDAGPGGYQLGRFPPPLVEWNDRFRDSVRGYWLNRPVTRGEFARRFCASSDVFHHGARRPTASVNYIAAHDGFTLADLTSYERKRNDANGEGGRDGRSGEIACAFGAEGEIDDASINATRRRVRRALLATLLLAQGTPMLLAGDELGRTQRGNNNAYCQDNPVSWFDWTQADTELAAFVARLIALRRSEPLLHHDAWFTSNGACAQVHWRTPDGLPMQVHDWHDHYEAAFLCELWPAGAGEPRLRIAFNPDATARRFAIGAEVSVALDSSGELREGSRASAFDVPGRALVVLR